MHTTLKRILMVEDDPDIQELVRLVLEVFGGFCVGACSNGLEALRKGPRFRPDLILLDVMMPQMDGPATLAALRELAGLEAVPVVFLTARAQPHEVNWYEGLGVAGVIAKPFDPLSLVPGLIRIWERCHGDIA
ncbi:MAG: response regulator [Rhodothermaceae bacterium]|nr:MAG: response regulator [Rhodothermaceae bacterium]